MILIKKMFIQIIAFIVYFYSKISTGGGGALNTVIHLCTPLTDTGPYDMSIRNEDLYAQGS